MERLQTGQHVSIAALGGSVSAGRTYEVVRGSMASRLYHSLVATVLRRSAARLLLQAKGVSHHNGALPATGPTFFQHCLDGAVPRSAHLVLLEFALNTAGDLRAFEQMLLQLLTRPKLAVIVVNVHAWTQVNATGRRMPGSCFRLATPRQIARGMKGRKNRPLPKEVATEEWMASATNRADQS